MRIGNLCPFCTSQIVQNLPKRPIEADSTILFQDSCVGWIGLILAHWLALVSSPMDLLGARTGPSRPAL